METKELIVDKILVSYIYFKWESQEFFVFLHGRWRSKEDWKNYFQRLQDKKVWFLAIDFPWFWHSQKPDSTRWVEEYSELVLHCIEKLWIKVAVSLVCHSFGWRIGLYLSANYPDKVYKLFLAAPWGIERLKSNLQKKVEFLWKKFLSIYILKPLKVWLIKHFWSTDYNAAWSLKDIFVRVVNQDLRHLLSQIKAQTYLYRWEKDNQILSWQIEILKREIKNLHLKTYSDVWHDVHIDCREDILNDMLADDSN